MLVKNSSNNRTKSFLNREKIEFRKYQKKIAEKCVNKNSLIVLPTGLGKTIIAVLVVADTLNLYPPESKVITLAPTRPLINQHYNSFLKFLTIPEEKFIILTGRTPPEKRAKLFKKSQFLFFTPQTLRNDLINRRYVLDDVCLIIFDEVHHASGDYPYTMIADKYMDQNPDGNILALTASPGASKKKIIQLCKIVHIPLENTHFRTRKDKDVQHYLKPMDIFKIGVDLTILMRDIYSVLKYILEERLQYLSQLGFLEVKAENLFKKVIRKDLLKLNTELIQIIKGDGEKSGAYSALSINAQALILYHMIELVEQQGLENLFVYLEKKIYMEAIKKNSSKAVKILASDHRLRQINIELKKNKEFSPEKLIHPKYKVLERLLKDELNRNPNSRILVFAKFRISVKNIVNKLKINENIKPVRFVGQAQKSKEDKGLSQKIQIEILDKFKEGKYNVLVSTNVGEEGLDIAECDMVVFYDVVTSEIRLIQRKGRTARHREGKVIILYTRETNDEVYMKIVLNKLKKMNINLKNPQDLNKNYNRKEKEVKLKIKETKWNPIDTAETEDRANMINKRKRQSNLQSFIKDQENKKSTYFFKKQFHINVSNLLPMKYGLRKKLSNDNILFKIIHSTHHIVIFEKVVIQIYHPRKFSDSEKYNNTLIVFNFRAKKKYQLVINIFDFIDFNEKFEGEKKLFKKKIQEFGALHELQIISIDNSEELYFIVKNVYQDKNQEE
ncbi:MAG: helicase-related protein [Promethearchaeota archaeon]